MNDITIILLIISVGVGIVTYFQRKQDDEEVVHQYDQERKDKLAELYQNVELRKDNEPIQEEVFWSLIDHSKARSSGDYKKQMGVMKDLLLKFSSEELIKIDNYYDSLLKEAYTWDLMAAAAIIFKKSDTRSLELLVCMLISRGQIIYNNATVNSNIIINQDFGEIVNVTIGDWIAELYLLKEKKIIPHTEEEPREPEGEKWQQKDLPVRYAELWQAFA